MKSYGRITAALSMAAAIMCTMGANAQSRSRSTPDRGHAIDLMAEGKALEKQGNTESAYEKYYQSAQLAPSPAAYYNLGRLARKSGNMAVASTWLQYALKMNPNYELAKLELAQVQAGRSGDNETARSMKQELAGDIAPGSTAAENKPINVDSLRQEVVTMQSLARPEIAQDNSAPGARTVPGGTWPEPTSPDGTASPETPARNAVIPNESSSIGNESTVKFIGDEIPSGSQSTDPLLSGPISDNTDNSDSGKKSGEKSTDDDLSAEKINKVAFSEESKKQPGSTVYDQESKVALGTFAFHREKGDSYRKSNRFREAAVEYKTALKLNPDDSDTRALLAEMLGRIGRNNAAGEQFYKAETEAPDNATVYYKRGNAYFDQQKYDLAIGAYRHALEIEPDNKYARNNLGVVYMEKKDFSRAIDSFKKVLEIDSKYEMAILNLGIIYDEDMVDKDQALKYYNQYLALNGPRKTEVQRWADAISSSKKKE